MLRKILLALAIVLILLASTLGGFWAYAAIVQRVPYDEAAPQDGRYLQAGDVRLFVTERGTPGAPLVLLVHGTGAWSAFWVETLDALAAAGYHAVAIDVPPFGFSQKPADGDYSTAAQARRILGAIDALQATRATLVGHSFGSRATLEAALQAPERVERLILVDAALDTDPDEPAPGLLARVASTRPARDLVVAGVVANPLLTRTLLRQMIHNDTAATDARVDLLQEPLRVKGLTRDAGAWLATFLAPEPKALSNTPSEYARLRAPVTLLWGEEDTVTPPEAGERLASLLRARLVLLPEVGHIPQIEEPPAFQRALLDALASQP